MYQKIVNTTGLEILTTAKIREGDPVDKYVLPAGLTPLGQLSKEDYSRTVVSHAYHVVRARNIFDASLLLLGFDDNLPGFGESATGHREALHLAVALRCSVRRAP